MINAPISVLRDMLDMAHTVEGCMLTIYESDHPLAGQVFREWCTGRGYAVREHSFCMPNQFDKPIRVLRADRGPKHAELFINVQLDKD